MPRAPVAIKAAGNERNLVHAPRRNMVRRISEPTAIFFAVNPPPRPIAATIAERSLDGVSSTSSTRRRSRSPFRIVGETWARDKRVWSRTPGRLAPEENAPRSGSQEISKAFQDAEWTPPAERVAAFGASAPSVILERDASGSTDPADARPRLLNPASASFLLNLGLEVPCRLFRVPRERQAREVIALRQDVPGLPKQGPDLRGAQVVGLRLLQDRFAGVEDRLGLLHLGGTELDRPLDLPLLALHREALRPPEEVPGLAVLSRGDRGPRGGVEPLGLQRFRAHVAGELDVPGDSVDRVLDLSNPKEPGVLRALRRLLNALPRREDRVRPRRPPELIRRPLGDPRSLLGRAEGGLEPPFLEPLAGLDEQFLDPCEIEGRIPTEEGGGQMVRRRRCFDLDQDLGRV